MIDLIFDVFNITVETGKVEMYGIDGPGDKLFRIIPELLPDRPPPGFMSFMESYHPRSATTSDEFDHLPTHHSGNDFNINDYLSREVSVLIMSQCL